MGSSEDEGIFGSQLVTNVGVEERVMSGEGVLHAFVSGTMLVLRSG